MDNEGTSVYRRGLGILARGLLLGLGFGISLAVVAFTAQYMMVRTAYSQVEAFPDSDSISEAKLKDISLSEVMEQKAGGRDSIIGIVKNNGAKRVRGIQIEANLFQAGKFVDQYSTYVSGSLAPGEARFFKIACGCKDSEPADHDSFKVRVTSTY